MTIHPLDMLQGYRLGSRQATVELQKAGAPGIHIPFLVLDLIDQLTVGGQAVVLTGTAGDGKTYLAYQILEALDLDRDAVLRAQRTSGFDQDGVYIDLDLSAGALTESRVARLARALAAPGRLTLICANEGKLAELESRLQEIDRDLPATVLRVNLSRRALVSEEAWAKVLGGVLSGPSWDGELELDGPLAWNRHWLADPDVADRIRRYLLLPYLLGEPITVREMLSFLAYALGGGLSSAGASQLPAADQIRYLFFNTAFSEPEGYAHGGRAAPTEKLLWWLYRFDPADQASPGVDLRLLVELDRLDVAPPEALLAIWRADLLVRPEEKSDTAYRQRLARYMAYARRWYALASEQGFAAYFPFRWFREYLAALSAPSPVLEDQIPLLIKGLNTLLSGGAVEDQYDLKLYYLIHDSTRQAGAIYSASATVESSNFTLQSELELKAEPSDASDPFLERLPRRLYLCYAEQPAIRLPISLVLYEVLRGAASETGGFPATLWARERDTVVRFMNALNREVKSSSPIKKFHIVHESMEIKLTYHTKSGQLTIN